MKKMNKTRIRFIRDFYPIFIKQNNIYFKRKDFVLYWCWYYQLDACKGYGEKIGEMGIEEYNKYIENNICFFGGKKI